jgi:tRNA A-37 threonylcarbamoyl transferase component Bud32
VNRTVWVDGERHKLEPSALLGQGGEAEVYDLGDGRVVKWWKPAEHPDFEGMPAAQDAAKERIAIGASKLRALPALPAGVVAPAGLALAKKAGPVVGYVMPRVSGVPLHSYGEPKWRRDNVVDGGDVVAALLALHDAIAGLHHAGIVVGDCNDLNVLVDGRRVHMIDVDSYQFGAFGCSMFSERFVDPRLCDAQVLVPVKPHDQASDWFAFASMAFRTLLGVGPWGGVHQPKDIATRCPPTLRALQRLWVLAKDVVYPRAARPVGVLPDELVDVFRAIFESDQRGVFPRVELERLRLRRCSTCGEEHGRVRCPACTTVAHLPPAVVHGRLTWRVIDVREVALVGHEITARTQPVWIAGDALVRSTRIGPERIGSVLPRQTRAWASEKLGVGFYRAGGYAVGFVFRPDRGVLDDRVTLPKLRGQLVDAHATIGADRAWLWLTTVDAGRLVTTCVVIGADAQVIASETLADSPWTAGIAGACAAGPHLFVPTDDGIARIEIVQGTITQTRTFAETAPLVSACDRLASNNIGGIDVVRRRDSIRLNLA